MFVANEMNYLANDVLSDPKWPDLLPKHSCLSSLERQRANLNGKLISVSGPAPTSACVSLVASASV